MKTDTFTQRILIPDEGKFLYNEKEKVISDKVYLGREADETEWVEITEAEKEQLEAKWAIEEQTNEQEESDKDSE